MSIVKTIGQSGQISLGKNDASQHVLIDEIELGVWVITIGNFVPKAEAWIHEPEVAKKLERAGHGPKNINLQKPH